MSHNSGPRLRHRHLGAPLHGTLLLGAPLPGAPLVGRGYLGTLATQNTVWPNGGRTNRSMSRVIGTTVRS